MNKQIEEMNTDIMVWFRENFYEVGRLSNYLYNKGYRKASDVVREIFADLETKAPWFCENQTAYEHFNEELAELKKKYTENKGE